MVEVLPMPPEHNFDISQLDLGRIVADREAIRRVNPQRFDFEQLDAIVFVDPARHLVIGYKDVRPEEFWVRGHMPEYPLLPGVLMCEAAAQLCGYYICSQNLMGGEFMGFGGLENVRFRNPVFPGERLVLVGKALKVHRRQTVCNVQGFVSGSLVFHGDIIGVPLRRKGEV
jgi:3-hydroxyacyl-[acyl-carrier-protein] dehydratase